MSVLLNDLLYDSVIGREGMGLPVSLFRAMTMDGVFSDPMADGWARTRVERR